MILVKGRDKVTHSLWGLVCLLQKLVSFSSVQYSVLVFASFPRISFLFGSFSVSFSYVIIKLLRLFQIQFLFAVTTQTPQETLQDVNNHRPICPTLSVAMGLVCSFRRHFLSLCFHSHLSVCPSFSPIPIPESSDPCARTKLTFSRPSLLLLLVLLLVKHSFPLPKARSHTYRPHSQTYFQL